MPEMSNSTYLEDLAAVYDGCRVGECAVRVKQVLEFEFLLK